MPENNILNTFINIVGKDFVIANEIELQQAAITNYATSEKVQLIIRPSNAEQLSKCMSAARELKVCIYPVSRGRNWGYGSRVPIEDNHVLVSLDRFNNIIDYDEDLAYVTIEAGVTFSQLFDFLQEKKSELIMSTTGGGGASSVVANALERGIGTGLYADRFAHTCGLEAVLPNGEIVQTGMGRFGENKSSKIYKWGMGPSLDGLFSQSNFGVVTKLTVWLMHCPEHFQLLFYKLKDDNNLEILMNKMRSLAMSGIVRPAITLYNDFRTLSTIMQYPWDECTPEKSTNEEVLAALRKNNPVANMIGKWNGEISIRSVNKEHGKVQVDYIKDAIKDIVDDVTVVDVPKQEMLHMMQQHYNQKEIVHDENIVKSFLTKKYAGIPDDTPVKQAYWRKKLEIPKELDPDKDGCGLIWICPIVPFEGNSVVEAVNTINKIVQKYKFEPAISLQCLTERAINIIASITWDRDIEGEDENAEKCYFELNERLNQQGYFPYRNTTKGMKSGKFTKGNFQDLLNDIKKVIDPENILSPNRYNIKG